jgi:glutamate racemase
MACMARLRVVLTALLTLACQFGCRTRVDSKIADKRGGIVQAILEDKESPFYLRQRVAPSRELPVGVFDSGTGGLTVLEAIVTQDVFDNSSREPGADGRPDFEAEAFIYLGDQANMPYGTYNKENNLALLREHILKDAQFLLGTRYHPSRADKRQRWDKRPVKVIVIACNTATAYGKRAVEALLSRARLDVRVIGVIDAGARAAVAALAGSGGSVAVLATVGTVASGGYVKALRSLGGEKVQVFQQAGLGLAGAIDGKSEFLAPGAGKPRDGYRGPVVDPELLRNGRYGLDWSAGRVLHDGTREEPRRVQLNSVENYFAYHLVSLLEQLRRSKEKPVAPLSALILGCTHYPFYREAIRRRLRWLRDYREGGRYIYRELMAPEVALVDPARGAARELYGHLVKAKLLGSSRLDRSAFYISVPNRDNPRVLLEPGSGELRFRYKYGRRAGEIQEYVKRVPFSRDTLSREAIERIRRGTPRVFELIRAFNHRSPHLRPQERIE